MTEPVDAPDAAQSTGARDGERLAYDTVAEEYAERMPDTRVEAPLDLAMVDAFAAAVVAAGDPRVLDAGCGAGRMSRYLTGRACRTEGVDLSPVMIRMARRDHPDLTFSVASLTGLPFADGTFGGVLMWYSMIHTSPAGQPRIFAEAARVLRPGGYLLVGYQHGDGVRDVGELYRAFGYDIVLERHNYTADQVAAHARSAGLRELCRLVRQPQPGERDGQGFLLARAS